MKKGFTLAELLITMGIIGVIAAILAPAIGNIMPDKNKGKVLKAYNTLSRVNQEMLEEPGLFQEYIVNGNTVSIGFGDPTPPANTDKYLPAKYASNPKYGLILASKLETNGEPKTKTNGVTFETADGIAWDVTTKFEMINNGANLAALTDIVIDVDPDRENSCYYGQSGCKNPDLYKFDVDTYGEVTGADPLTKAYLLNPDRMNDKKADYAKAATLE